MTHIDEDHDKFVKELNENHDKFVKELKTLLETYNASIDFIFDNSSDSCGIIDPKMIVSYRKSPKSFQCNDKKLTDGYYIDANQL